MRLSFEQIKTITQGAAEIEQKNGSVAFFRFNKQEREVYSKTEFFAKTFATAGIQMEFETDGDALDLNIKTSAATSRTFFSIDIFVNEMLLSNVKNFDDKVKSTDYISATFELGAFEKRLELGRGIKRVRIVFPWSVATELAGMEIENATYVKPLKKDKTMLIYGDSITNGYDALYSSGTLAARLAHELGAEGFNKAIGGEVFRPALAEVKNDISPDYILVAYGTNEWSKSEQSDFYKRCHDFFDALVRNYPDVPIFALTPIWRKDVNGERAFGKFEDVGKLISDICSKHKNITVLSGWELVPHDEKYYSDLRLHPNDDGFEHYFNNLIKEFERLNLKK